MLIYNKNYSTTKYFYAGGMTFGADGTISSSDGKLRSIGSTVELGSSYTTNGSTMYWFACKE